MIPTLEDKSPTSTISLEAEPYILMDLDFSQHLEFRVRDHQRDFAAG